MEEDEAQRDDAASERDRQADLRDRAADEGDREADQHDREADFRDRADVEREIIAIASTSTLENRPMRFGSTPRPQKHART